VVSLLVAAAALVTLVRSSPPRAVSYSRDVQPIFDAKCISCHPVAYPYLDLHRGRSYRQLVGAVSPLSPAFERVLPGRPELSYLLTHVPDPSRRHLLSPAERGLIARWIRLGAKDD
jgi:hypothetical protein